MRLPTAQESLIGWKKARESKVKILFFCFFGLIVGTGVYFIALYIPVPLHLVQFGAIIKSFEKIVGLVLIAVYGGAVIFFMMSLFTGIWERICDHKIKKFQDKITAFADQRSGVDDQS